MYMNRIIIIIKGKLMHFFNNHFRDIPRCPLQHDRMFIRTFYAMNKRAAVALLFRSRGSLDANCQLPTAKQASLRVCSPRPDNSSQLTTRKIALQRLRLGKDETGTERVNPIILNPGKE